MSQVTVFCAVWHRDPNRHALIRSHRENLRRQTVAVHPVYVFDGGDAPPADLDAETLCSSTALTVYQAWNLGLLSARTPLVMNLNLDDRLAPDAVEKMVQELERSGAALVGGDWRICYSPEETDAVTPCYPAQQLPLPNVWPPPTGMTARLGSGENSITYGPATLWRVSVHAKVPRYPWRFGDGSLIRSKGDGFFWDALRAHGFRLARLNQIVGNYHSHPGEQAEFRADAGAEQRLAGTIGVRVF